MTSDTAENSPTTFLVRVAIGLFQGIALFLLVQAGDAKTWPATQPMLYAPLLTVCAYVPLIAVVGFGNLRRMPLALWIAVATALCVGLAVHDVFRDPNVGGGRHAPQAIVWLALAAILFIAHSLIVASDTERKYLAGYATDFEVSWKLGVQGALAGAFVGAFWLLLWLGAELFRLIRIELLADLIQHNWFWIPATAFVFACALHITDVRAGIVQGARTLALVLLSWLLPVMMLFAIAFVLALPFTGLEPLWSTRRATAILLTASAALVFLINAAYQDGRRDAANPVRYACHAAALVLVPLVALAGYGLWLRIAQYGWTAERVYAGACVVVAACYAIGYAIAALRWRARLADVEITNIATALVSLAVLFVLFTPIADPARIAVADQMRRLHDGRIAPEKFDYDFLRFRSGRYGLAALAELAAQEPTNPVAQRAKRTLAAKSQPDAPTAQSRAASITLIHPAGQTLPERFLSQNWTNLPRSWRFPPCLTAHSKCEAMMADLDDDGTPEILLFNLPSGGGAAFKAAGDGSWTFLGAIANAQCKGVRDALRSATPVRTVTAAFKEIEVNGNRLRVESPCAEEADVPSIAARPQEDKR